MSNGKFKTNEVNNKMNSEQGRQWVERHIEGSVTEGFEVRPAIIQDPKRQCQRCGTLINEETHQLPDASYYSIYK